MSEMDLGLDRVCISEEEMFTVATECANQYLGEDADSPRPINEGAGTGTVRFPASIYNLAGCDVRAMGGTLVRDGDYVRLRYDDGRVSACLAYEAQVRELVTEFFEASECWR